jgi:hypothetical protein
MKYVTIILNETFSGYRIDKVSVCVAFPKPSSTCTVNSYVPPAVGVPDILPVVTLRLKPSGRLPEIIDHSYVKASLKASRVTE